MIEYSVIWKRQYMRKRRKIWVNRETAERYLVLLTHPEPWVALGQSPDAYHCCPSKNCYCGGLTEREWHEGIRANVAPLEFARLEVRHVDPWEKAGSLD